MGTLFDNALNYYSVHSLHLSLKGRLVTPLRVIDTENSISIPGVL